jgi:toxin-antitoxin system PIN domain toxin
MTWFFPDVNVWLALSHAANFHNGKAWIWLNLVAPEDRLIFSRYTQLGLLRLLTNQSVMGEQTLTLREAWEVYDHWLEDSRVEFYPEPSGVEGVFREATAPFASKAASKWLGDCYLLAYAKQSHATLATFDKALRHLARKQHCRVVEPGSGPPKSPPM